MDHRHRGNNRYVASLPFYVSLSQWYGVNILGHFALQVIYELMFYEYDGIIVPYRAYEQSFGIVSGGGSYDLQSRNVHEPRLKGLGMLCRRRSAGAACRPYDHRYFRLSAEHIAHLRRLIVYLVHGNANEVHEHYLCHGPQPSCSSAQGIADNCAFRDWRIYHALGPELVYQPRRHAEAAAEHPNVLANDVHVGIAPHLLA